jgi:dCMP deaminase
MDFAFSISRRSHDPRLNVGAVIVSEDNSTVLSIGYNGNAPGLPAVPESTEPGKSNLIHAEVNAIVKFPWHPSNHVPKVMYVTVSPCVACSKLILAAKISQVIYAEEYRDPSGIDLLREHGVEIHKLSDLLQEGSIVICGAV